MKRKGLGGIVCTLGRPSIRVLGGMDGLGHVAGLAFRKPFKVTS